MSKRLVVGITGASGVIYGIRLLEVLRANDEVETHLVISPAAKATIAQETDWKVSAVEALADAVYDIASGSFATVGMVIIPCSIKTLSAVAHSYSADLISRAADVTLKEGRPLVLVVREAPLHLGHLRLMLRAAAAGAPCTGRTCRCGTTWPNGRRSRRGASARPPCRAPRPASTAWWCSHRR
ncbi:MAG: hypothetical protein C4309_11325, partial [Chloroflexota bacterium]